MSRKIEILRRGAPQDSLADKFPRHRSEHELEQPRHQRGTAEDEIAKLVRRVFFCSSTAKPPALVCFSGVDRRAGSSWVCARASELLAEQVPGRVCVLDANLRSPWLHEYFGAGSEGGLADAMTDGTPPIRNFVRTTWSSHLWLMTSGVVAGKTDAALNPERVQARLSELRREFDFIVVDTPSVNTYSDAVLLGRVSDGVILVIDSNVTRRESARAAKEALQASRVAILGAVLNRRSFPIPEALYKWI